MTIPVILFRRYRASRLTIHQLPPRRAGTNAFTPSTIPLGPPSASPSHAIPQQDTFNGPLYAAKALGIATAIVISGGAATVWMVKTSLGVNTVRLNVEMFSSSSFSAKVPDFANRARGFIRTAMPTLVSRLNSTDGSQTPSGVATQDTVLWNKEDTERRMQEAYETDGLVGWTKAALLQLEAELYSELERAGVLDGPDNPTSL